MKTPLLNRPAQIILNRKNLSKHIGQDATRQVNNAYNAIFMDGLRLNGINVEIKGRGKIKGHETGGLELIITKQKKYWLSKRERIRETLDKTSLNQADKEQNVLKIISLYETALEKIGISKSEKQKQKVAECAKRFCAMDNQVAE